jgi:hypothetical protein
MPMYTFKDEKSELTVEVLRSFADYKVPPTDDELPEQERGKTRQWTKIIDKGIRTVANRNWSPSKGHHAVIIGLFPWWELLRDSLSSLLA